MYPYILFLHIVAIIAWMAGMLYLPRLFVYHADALPGGEASETFKVMERRLLKLIINPAMIVAFLTGGTLLWLNPEHLQHGYMHAKLALVFAMAAAHGYLAASVRRFAAGRNARSSKFWRIFNEVPTLLLIGIVFFIVVKPF
jgi:putative membrane protein